MDHYRDFCLTSIVNCHLEGEVEYPVLVIATNIGSAPWVVIDPSSHSANPHFKRTHSLFLLITTANKRQLLATDLLVLATMKNAAKCEK